MILPWGIIILLIFAATLILIISEKIDETAMALFAMAASGVVLFFGMGVRFYDYVIGIQWDAILFVTATLIIVAIAGSSGMFQFIALFIAQRTDGEPKRVFVAFLLFVFLISLFFDPFPTILVMGSFTIQVCRALDMDFRPLLISEIIVANFASVPSVVGSVQNVLIAYAVSFIINPVVWFVVLGPLAVALFLITLMVLLRYYGTRLTGTRLCDTSEVCNVAPSSMIRSRRDFTFSVVGMAVLIVGFTVAPNFEINPGLIALMIASVMLILSQDRAKTLLQELSWDSVFYLIALFGLVQALTMTEVTTDLVDAVTSLTGGSTLLAIAFLIWIPGAALAVVDSVPVSLLFSDLAIEIGNDNSIVPLALVVGVNTSGYIIPTGDSTNIMAFGLSSEHGMRISWKEFMMISIPLGVLHLGISTLYLSIAAILGIVWALLSLAPIALVCYIAVRLLKT